MFGVAAKLIFKCHQSSNPRTKTTDVPYSLVDGLVTMVIRLESRDYFKSTMKICEIIA